MTKRIDISRAQDTVKRVIENKELIAHYLVVNSNLENIATVKIYRSRNNRSQRIYCEVFCWISGKCITGQDYDNCGNSAFFEALRKAGVQFEGYTGGESISQVLRDLCTEYAGTSFQIFCS